MPKVLLITFTGTGNTALCGDFIAKAFTQKGYDVFHYVYKAGKTICPNPNDFDLVGVGYPIHAFNTPQPFVKMLKGLPQVNNKPYFIYKVSGEPFKLNNASSHLINKKLTKKGYILFAEKHFLMPYNIMFRYNLSLEKQMYLYLGPLCKAYVEEITTGDYERIKYKFPQIVLSTILRIEWVAPKVNSPFVSINTKKCIDCGMCMNNCPTNSLYKNKKGKIKIHGSSCAMCMRCTLNCPTNAIRYGFMNPWKINGKFNYQKLAADSNIHATYVNYKTKGYFSLFRKYYLKQNDLLRKYKIPIPVEYKDGEELERIIKAD